jgi:hypothetical protein
MNAVGCTRYSAFKFFLYLETTATIAGGEWRPAIEHAISLHQPFQRRFVVTAQAVMAIHDRVVEIDNLVESVLQESASGSGGNCE